MSALWSPEDSFKWYPYHRPPEPFDFITNTITPYENKVGKKLSIFFLPHFLSTIEKGIHWRKMDEMEMLANNGIIPGFTYSAYAQARDQRYAKSVKIKSDKSGSRKIMDEIIRGEYDKKVSFDASKLRKFGEEHGGFFIRTFREMNLPGTYPWSGNPTKAKKAYDRIWNLFEDAGANEFATWILDLYCAGNRYKLGSNVHEYIPADRRQFDWIGMNGFNYATMQWGLYETFNMLFKKRYKYFSEFHGDKPIMIVETGTGDSFRKPGWVRDAYKDVKDEFPGIKAFNWWSELWIPDGKQDFDTRINSSKKAFEAYKEGISDPYFLERIPYRNLEVLTADIT